MQEIPKDVFTSLSAADAAATRTWWESLSADERAEFIQLWDARTDATSLICVKDEQGKTRWESLPIELRGSLGDDEDGRERRMWRDQDREYSQARFARGPITLVRHRFHIGDPSDNGGVRLAETARFDPDEGAR